MGPAHKLQVRTCNNHHGQSQEGNIKECLFPLEKGFLREILPLLYFFQGLSHVWNLPHSLGFLTWTEVRGIDELDGKKDCIFIFTNITEI